MRLFTDTSSSDVDPWLRRALELAERGRGTTSPNPVVGCVIVREGKVVGEGFHERAGGPHAEAAALSAAGRDAQGATAYVTLEPCNHDGRTPPCAPALVHAGVAEVVIGMRDPDLSVSGGGAAALLGAGVAVRFADDATPFQEQNVEWTTALANGRPFVRVKTAVTLDGRPALAHGVRASLSGEGARALTMRLRAASDAVMVGAATMTIDDPALTVRDADGEPATRQSLRVVLCRTGQPPVSARMFNDRLGKPVLLLPEEATPDLDLLQVAEIERFPIAEGIRGAIRVLGDRGIVSLLVEAGPRMLTALWEEDLIDELVLYHAGGMAGDEAPALYVGESQEDRASLARGMRAVEAGVAGNDAVTVWRRSGALGAAD
jgi:diaminohydroxyphosphoribosylaminopyrimidine deaminase/5-amino-6-(5-phosphoribosylamino)uracil reductase